MTDAPLRVGNPVVADRAAAYSDGGFISTCSDHSNMKTILEGLGMRRQEARTGGHVQLLVLVEIWDKNFT